MYVLPVDHAWAMALATGKARQLPRNFPCDPSFIGQSVAIQATAKPVLSRAPGWSIVCVGKLAGVCYYPGFVREPTHVIGQTYKRHREMPAAWGWTFKNMTAVTPVPLAVLPTIEGRSTEGLDVGAWTWVDDGSGDWWGCCLRELDVDTMRCVRKARRKRD